MKTPIYIKHRVGTCMVCGAPILDAGWTADPNGWAHAMPLNQVLPIYTSGGHMIIYGACAMVLTE
jgi:hypothetical protein